jgi:hypothetical protein
MISGSPLTLENAGIRLTPTLPVFGHRKTLLPPGDKHRFDWLIDSTVAAV